MNIHFFEEYPSEENLKKAGQTGFPTKVFIAAKTPEEFQKAQIYLHQIGVPAVYWPLLEKAYWISPFSDPGDLSTLQTYAGEFAEILFDQELPVIRKNLFIRNAHYFFKNTRKIQQLYGEFARKKTKIFTAEYPATGPISQFVLRCLGVAFDPEKLDHTKIIMFYSSMIPSSLQAGMRRQLRSLSRKYGKRVQIGLGTIQTGVFGDEPILSPEHLEKDLEFARAAGFDTAVIFRLGGLNDSNLEVLQRFASK